MTSTRPVPAEQTRLEIEATYAAAARDGMYRELRRIRLAIWWAFALLAFDVIAGVLIDLARRPAP